MKIGTTAGSFDLLHAGHILMLKDCKTVCDYLIVLLQTDPTIDRPFKNKPIQTIEERLICLEAVRYVDEVVIYTTEDELKTWLYENENRIDIRILGSDHKDNTEITAYNLKIPLYFHYRDHAWSSTGLRNRVYISEKNKRCE